MAEKTLQERLRSWPKTTWYDCEEAADTLDQREAEIARLREALRGTQHCLGFLRSVIQSGEPWTETCQSAYDNACTKIDSALSETSDMEGLVAVPREPDVDWLENAAARVHQAYLNTCVRLGWQVKPENAVPYDDLPEDAKELDRASVLAVLAAQPGKGGEDD